MAGFRVWVEAARLRTLPLSFASILLGSLLAAARGEFRWAVLILTLLTTLALQILSNYANDLGDTLHGADHAGRKGPKRAVQAGVISITQMRRAVILTGAAALVFGSALLLVALNSWEQMAGFFALGLVCIAGAILYTNGRKPYGYAGLGDIAVFLFFGMTGVLGTYFLYGPVWDYSLLLPATSAGLLATGVLNVNNLRDIPSDAAAGKNSIPVRLGFEGGKRYHAWLIWGGIFANLGFTLFAGMQSPYRWLWVIPAIGLVRHQLIINRLQSSAEADPYLKQLSLLALATDVALGVGVLLAHNYSGEITLF